MGTMNFLPIVGHPYIPAKDNMNNDFILFQGGVTADFAPKGLHFYFKLNISNLLCTIMVCCIHCIIFLLNSPGILRSPTPHVWLNHLLSNLLLKPHDHCLSYTYFYDLQFIHSIYSYLDSDILSL